MKRMRQIAVCIVENVVGGDNVIILMELACMVMRPGTMVQNARKVRVLYSVTIRYLITVDI